MRRKLMIPLLILAILSFGMVGLAQADFTWSFNPAVGYVTSVGPPIVSTSGDLGTTAFTFTDTSSGSDIMLPAVSFGSTTLNLYSKSNADPAEVGLGLVNPTANEIDSSHFIQLDTSPMKAAGAVNLTLGIGSIQEGEGYTLYGSNVSGTLGAPINSYVAMAGDPVTDSFTIAGAAFTGNQFFQIQATMPNPGGVSDVLILNDATAAVPIPGAVFLLGSGLLGLVGYGRSRKFLKS
jgi:hypothetical protein